MAIAINGSGTVTGISVGGLPDGIVDDGTLATNSVDSAELIDGSIDASHLASGVGGSWNIIGTSVASASASLTVTGLNSTYDTFVVGISDVVPATDTANLYLRMGDSSGIDSGASDYNWTNQQFWTGATSYAAATDTADSEIQISTNVGSAAGEGYGALLYVSRPGDGSMRPMIHGTWISNNDNANELQFGGTWGSRLSVITLDRIQIFFSSGNIASGRLTVWGIAHA